MHTSCPVAAQVALPATAAQLATARRFFDGAGGAPGVGAGVAAGVRDRVVGRVQARPAPGRRPGCPELPGAGQAGARHARAWAGHGPEARCGRHAMPAPWRKSRLMTHAWVLEGGSRRALRRWVRALHANA